MVEQSGKLYGPWMVVEWRRNKTRQSAAGGKDGANRSGNSRPSDGKRESPVMTGGKVDGVVASAGPSTRVPLQPPLT